MVTEFQIWLFFFFGCVLEGKKGLKYLNKEFYNFFGGGVLMEKKKTCLHRLYFDSRIFSPLCCLRLKNALKTYLAVITKI